MAVVDSGRLNDAPDEPWNDRYDRLARQFASWHLDSLDDRPTWEQEQGVVTGWCRTCHRDLELDDFGQCERCRLAAGWCRWCVDEPIAYRARGCCRSCYRWLVRNQDRYDDADLMERLRAVVERRRARKRR